MVTTGGVDLGTLGWVKEEIDETLKKARLALEAFAEQRTDDGRLRLCATYLHQIGGTLKMVELDAIAELVFEAEALAQSLLSGTEAPTEASLEPLVRFILTLPDILDRAQTPHAGSIPGALPLLNDLRAARGAPPAEAQALFAPDLAVRPPQIGKGDDSDFIRAFRKERASYQAALVRWLKDPRDADSARVMRERLAGWQHRTAFLPVAQCLWVGSAFVGLAGASAEPALAHKKLLGRLDQQLKRFADGQDRSSARVSCERLTREMLFAIDQQPSDDADVAAVRAAFGLGAPVPAVTLPSVEALRSIAGALGREIGAAQGFLSSYLDSAQGEPLMLDELLRVLARISKTFATLSIEPLCALAEEVAATCRQLGDGQLLPSSSVAMGLAQALLQMETAVREIPLGQEDWQALVSERRAALRALGGPSATPAGAEVSAGTLTEQDRHRLIGAVGGEIRVNLARLEEAFLAFVAAPADRALLAGLPTLAAQVEAAFRIVGDEAAALIGRALQEGLDALALGHIGLNADLAEAVAIGVGALEAQVVGLERGHPLEAEQLAAVLASLTAASAATAAAPPAVATRSTGPVAPGDRGWPAIDPEILPVFLEDAHDAIHQLDESFAAWRDNRDDENALTIIRRAFHTLKGSGRMVEAGEIAELAYDAEGLLNRVRSRQLVATDEVVHWIGVAHEHVRTWVAALEQQQPLPVLGVTRAALQALISDLPVADEPAMATIGGGGDQDAPGPVGAVVVPVEETAVPIAPDAAPRDGVVSDDAVPTLLATDPILRDIFVTEIREHMLVLQAAIATGSATPVSAALLRAAHTMQGSTRSVGLTAMAENCAALEHYLQALEVREAVLGEDGVAVLAALTDISERLLAELTEARLQAPLAALAARLAGLLAVMAPDPSLTWWQKGAEPIGATTEATSTDEPIDERPAAIAPPLADITMATDTVGAIDPELQEIFRDEARDLLDELESSLAAWRADLQNEQSLQDLKRVLHTLKGAARMTGAMTIGEVSHATEELLRRVEEGLCPRDDRLIELLDNAAGHLGVLYQAFIDKRPPADVDREQELLTALQGEAPNAAAATAEVPVNDSDDEVFRSEVTSQVRVRTALLDRLVNYAGEVSIARSRMEQQVFRLREHLDELNGNVMRFRDQLRDLEIQADSQIMFRTQVGGEGNAAADFDPLEFDRYSRLQQLSRGLTENLHDLITLHGTLDMVASQAEAVLQQQARVNTDLQEGLMRTRMVSFATQAHRLRQIVRQTAHELGKKAELTLVGADVELDRHLLERMIGPFEHMIRNAMDHGIEPTAERVRAGKPAVGHIRIETVHESGDIVVRFADDGAGLPINRIRAKAIERKLVAADAVLTDEQVMQFILLPGFSTAGRVTHLSGRGVGMDVVHNEVKKLGGVITVETHAGRGTTFIIRLPLTLSITQALMVGCADQIYAIPLAAIINVVEAPAAAITDALALAQPVLRYSGRDYPFMDLGVRLGLPRPAVPALKSPVLLLRLDNREVAVAVDTLSGTREVVVKALGPQLAEIRGLFGATILGDGRVVLILDIPGLWTEDDTLRVVSTLTEVPAIRRPLVLVVDDSLTVRKVTSRFLQKQGYDVVTAKDGVEALEHLREVVADVMLVDIEMPRMDGYELTARIRDDQRLRHIPIIMITSRSGLKHRERAMSLGVDVYLGKPYQEEDVRRHIEALLSRPRA